MGEFSNPYNLTKHITNEFNEGLESAKWLERKDAIQGLIDVMEKNPVLSPNDAYQKLIDDLSKVLSKDSNINVTAVAAVALSKLASGTPSMFKHNAPAVVLLCLTRMKEVKPVIKNACTECLDSVYSTTTFANVIEPIKKGLSITAPGSKTQSCEFFTRIMLKLDFPTAKNAAAGTKEIVGLLCNLALGSDVGIREASNRSLAAFMRAITKNIALPLLGPIASDKLKMEKIEENYEKFIVEYPFDDGTRKIEATAPTCTGSNGMDNAVNGTDEPEVVDSRLFATPYDLTKHITNEFNENLLSKKWSDRKDAIQGLIDVMEKNPVLEPSEVYQKLIDDLSKVLSKDPNINVAATAAQLLGKIAFGERKLFAHNAPAVVLLCLTRMKEVKPVIKNACVECLDLSYSTTTFANVIEPIKQGLVITAPGSKIQTCEFFTRIMLKIDFQTAKASSTGTKEIVGLLCNLALGSDVGIREASSRSLAAFMRAITKNIALPLLGPIAADKLKMEKIEENYEKFIVEYPFKGGIASSSSSTGMNKAASSCPKPSIANACITTRRPVKTAVQPAQTKSMPTKSVNTVKKQAPTKPVNNVKKQAPTKPLNNVKMNALPPSNRVLSASNRVLSASSRPVPNVVRSTATSQNGSTEQRVVVEKKSIPEPNKQESSANDQSNQRRSMLRPPSAVIRPNLSNR